MIFLAGLSKLHDTQHLGYGIDIFTVATSFASVRHIPM